MESGKKYYEYLKSRSEKKVSVFIEKNPLFEDFAPFESLTTALYRKLLLSAASSLDSLFMIELCRKDLLFKSGDEKETKKAEEEFALKLQEDGEKILLESSKNLFSHIEKAEKVFFDFVSETLNRIYSDKNELSSRFFGGKAFSKITQIQFDCGDSHNNGRTTVIFKTDAGKAVYKPHDLTLDEMMKKLCNRYFPKSILVPDCINKKIYGYSQFIENNPAKGNEEASVYYENLGALSVVFCMLGSRDFHLENLLASGTKPVPVDMEMIINPSGENTPDLSVENNYRNFRLSLYGSCLMPSNFEGFEISPLFSESEENLSCPEIDGKKVNVVPFRENFLSGFKKAYGTVLEHKDEILSLIEESSENAKIRYVMRATKAYAVMSSKLNSLGWIDNPEKDIKVYEALSRGVNKAGMTCGKEICGSEAKAILRDDIPYFYADFKGHDLSDLNGVVSENYFRISAYESVKEHLENLSEREMKFETDLLSLAMTKVLKNSEDAKESVKESAVKKEKSEEKKKILPETIRLLSKKQCIQEAEKIFERISEDKIETPDGNVYWFSTDEKLSTAMNVQMFGVYGGLFSEALFFNALYKVSESEKIKNEAERFVRKIVNQFEKKLSFWEKTAEVQKLTESILNASFADGIAGFIFALKNMNDVLKGEENALIERLLNLLPNLDLTYANTDLLCGISGLVKVLSMYDDLLEKKGIKEYVKMLCKLFLEKRNEDGLWKSEDESAPLSGAAHGQTGIASALEKAGRKLNRKEYIVAAQKAYDYEEKIFTGNEEEDSENAGWPDYRKDAEENQFMSGWCAGAPGIGFDLLKNGNESKKNFSRALTLTMTYKLLMRDHLCCGNMSRVDFLLEEFLSTHDEKYYTKALKIMSEVVQRAEKNGGYTFLTGENRNIFIPNLFQGASGIGCELLRLASPEEVKSVLL